MFENPASPRVYPEDEGQLARAAGSDPAAFHLLYRHVLPRLYRYYYDLAGETGRAEALTRAALQKACARLSARPQKSTFSAWALALSRPAAADLAREPAPPVNGELAPRLLQKAAPAGRELLRLRYAAELTLPEISAVIRRPAGMAERSLRASLQTMLEGLADFGLQPPENAAGWLSGQLTQYYARVDPDPRFALELENELWAGLQAASAPRPSWGERLAGVFSARLRLGTLALAGSLALTAAVLWLGPPRVLAAAQDALVAAGLSYVNLDGARVLDEPVTVSQEMRTGHASPTHTAAVELTVSQVIAHQDGTLVRFQAQGLEASAAAGTEDYSSAIHLRLPDGTMLRPLYLEVAPGGAYAVFPRLPLDVMEVTLTIDRLPLMKSGQRPENWEVPLPLRKANAADPAERPPLVYRPEVEGESRQGITLDVLQAEESYDETAVLARVNLERPGWRLTSLPPRVELVDTNGQVYDSRSGRPAGELVVRPRADWIIGPFGMVISGTPEEQLPDDARTYRFPGPLPPGGELTLRMGKVSASADLDLRLRIDELLPAGADPQSGGAWESGRILDLGGVPVELRRVGYYEDEIRGGRRRGRLYQYRLELYVLEEGLQISRMIYSLGDAGTLRGVETPVMGSRFDLEISSFSPFEGPVEVRLHQVTFTAAGPWEVRWPSRLPAPAVETSAYTPDEAVAEQDGLTVRAERVERSDFLTRVRLGVSGLPEGYRLVGWSPPEALLARESPAGPLEPLPVVYRDPQLSPARPEEAAFAGQLIPGRQASLEVQALTLAAPGQAAFTLSLPDRGEMAMEIIEARGVDEQLGAFEYCNAVHSSGRWPVDISIQAGGMKLHFYRASLSGDSQRPNRFLLRLEGEVVEQSDLPVQQIVIGRMSITGPGGETYTEASSLVKVGTTFTAFLDLGSAYTGQGGEARVEFYDMQVIVTGPWRLNWAAK